MINKYTNKQRGLLAIIMAMVMVFAGATLVASDIDVDADTTSVVVYVNKDAADDSKDGLTEANAKKTLDGALGVTGVTKIVLLSDVTLKSDGRTLIGVDGLTIEGNDNKITMADDISIGYDDSSFDGSIYFKDVEFVTCGNGISDTDSQILVGSKVTMESCIISGPGQYGVHSYEGSELILKDVDFNGKKLNPAQGAYVDIQKATEVYLNLDQHAEYAFVSQKSTTITKGEIKIGDVNFESLAVRCDTTLDLGGQSITVNNIFVRTPYDTGIHANCANAVSTISNGTITATIDKYEDKGAANLKLDEVVLKGTNQLKSPITISGEFELAAGAQLGFTGTLNAEVTAADGSKVTFTSIVGSQGATISNGSVVIGGDVTISGGSIIVNSGTAKVNATTIDVPITVHEGATLIVPKGVEVSGKVTNNGTIDLSGELTNDGTDVNANSNSGTIEVNDVSAVVNATNTGTIILNKQIANNSSDVDGGTIALANGITVPVGVNGDNVVSAESVGDSFGMSKDLESDYTVKSSAFLANDLTIPEGVTLTIDGTLSLNGKKLFVEGTLAVSKKGAITDIATDDGAIVLSKTGAIVNEGIIGKDSTVTVTDKETGGKEVSMKNVIGLSFGLTKEIGTDGPTYTLTVSGEAAKKGDAPSLTITGAYVTDFVVKDVEVRVTDVTILKNGTLSIGTKGSVTINDGNDVETEVGIVMKDGSELVIDGAVTGKSICMYNGSIATINGSAQDVDFTARTGEYPTYTDGKRNNLDTTEVSPNGIWVYADSITTLGNLNGITIEITSKSFTKEVDEKDVPYIEQMMNVYGTAAFADKDKDLNGFANADEASAAAATLGIVPSGDITIVGNVYVPAGSELILGEDMDLVTSGANVIITVGLLKTLEDDNNNYKGSKYVIEATTETGSPYPVFYYTNFDDAYAAIATADEMTVYIAGGYEFTKEYTIAAEQEIVFVSAGSEGFKISKDGKVTVEADGTIDVDTVNFATKGIKGILIVMDDATCIPTTGSYEVSSKDADNNMTYTSAELAIANAQAGETIYITDNVTFEDKTTIPEGVTVEIANGATVTAEDDLVVEGKLVNEGTIVVEVTGDDEKADLIVRGEIDNTAGVVTVDGDATITGTFEGVLAASNINAAKYYDGENDVYTSIASAVAACAEMDVIDDVNVTGKVSESSDVVLAEGQKLIIDGEVALKSISLNIGSNLTVNGKLTADVIAATGVMDTTGALADSVVSVKEIEDVEFDVKKNDAKNTVTMYMDVTTPGTMKGTTTVTAGSVQLDAVLTVDKTNVMKVSEGATLVVMENITAESGKSKYFSNAGIMVINDDNVTLNGLNLGGTVDVAEKKALTVSNVTVSGTLTTGEDASVTVAGGKYMYIGSKPTTLGAAGTVNADVAFGNNAYIVMFEGSTFTNTDADVKMDSTAYTINDIAFATVYVAEGNSAVLVKIIDPLVIKLEDLDVKFTDTDEDGVWDDTEGYTIDWKSGSTGANTVPVGQYDTVNAKIGYASVNITISVGPGMLVYIDDIKDTDGKESLTIGTHTITVYIEKGYEGTPAITLNGVAVTDGKLVITTDMMDLEQNLLSVTGATVMQDQPVVIQPSDSEKDGMELTDILLIVLVVLIVIMAIIVALRMMRS